MTSPVATFRAANKEMYHGACSRGFDAPGALVASAKWVAFDPTPESGTFHLYRAPPPAQEATYTGRQYLVLFQ